MKIMLEAARINAGYTQMEAAQILGMHYQTLAKYEEDSSKMPYDFIQKLPTVYGIPTDYIFLVIKTSLFVLSEKKRSVLVEIREDNLRLRAVYLQVC